MRSAAFLKAFRDSKYVAGAFYGLRPASTAMITAAGLTVMRVAFLRGGELSAIEWKAVVLAAALLVFTRVLKTTKKWHPIVWIGVSAAAGVLFRFGA